MGLNIKTGTVTQALCERLEREVKQRDMDTRLRRMRTIAERCALLVGPGLSSTQHGDLLYDEHGLPK